MRCAPLPTPAQPSIQLHLRMQAAGTRRDPRLPKTPIPNPLSVSNLSLQYPYDIGKRGTNHVQRLGCAVWSPRTWLPLRRFFASCQRCFGRLAWMHALPMPMQGHRLLSRLFKHRTLMGRQHHPHPLKYTAAAFPGQKATLGRFKSIGSSIPAASWCRGSEEEKHGRDRLLFCRYCCCAHDQRKSCCWRCGSSRR